MLLNMSQKSEMIFTLLELIFLKPESKKVKAATKIQKWWRDNRYKLSFKYKLKQKLLKLLPCYKGLI